MKQALNAIEKQILKPILYFDLFSYPLLFSEIKDYCSIKDITKEDLNYSLNSLKEKNKITQTSGFYHIPGKEFTIERRIKGNVHAESIIRKSIKYAKTITACPFVKEVYISGSLSKGYADKKSDTDFFIITAPGRLWLCRTLLVLFKKVLLLNSRKFFCINYLISSDNLEITDKNYFTAMELSTLLRVSNGKVHQEFMRSNSWVSDYFPNQLVKKSLNISSTVRLQKTGEFIFQGVTGNILDDFCYKLTYHHWKRKFPWMRTEEFEVNFRSKKTVSKHHPNGFQFKVLKAFEEKLAEFDILPSAHTKP